LGAQPRPTAPSARVTSASTVGLPRESKISRPVTCVIVRSFMRNTSCFRRSLPTRPHRSSRVCPENAKRRTRAGAALDAGLLFGVGGLFAGGALFGRGLGGSRRRGLSLFGGAGSPLFGGGSLGGRGLLCLGFGGRLSLLAAGAALGLFLFRCGGS